MRTLAALVLAVSVAALAAGCGGGGGSGDADARAAIEQNWETFFDGSGSASPETRAGLLQNGAQFESIIRTVAANPLSKQLSAKVDNVDVTGPDSAKVKYTLYLGKTAVLKNAEGTAVREDGTWKVGYASFCQLLALQGATPKACASASK
jgi:hypothetical protein